MKKPNALLVFLVCLLGVPLATRILPGLSADPVSSAIFAGVLLGAFHVILRPVLRFVTKPLGCLTLGFFTFAIDVALLYLCSHYVAGFVIHDVGYAVCTALFINILCVLFRK